MNLKRKIFFNGLILIQKIICLLVIVTLKVLYSWFFHYKLNAIILMNAVFCYFLSQYRDFKRHHIIIQVRFLSIQFDMGERFMSESIISKSKFDSLLKSHPPIMGHYQKFYTHFSWEQARGELSGLPQNKGLNIAFEAVTRHSKGEKSHHLALRCIAKNGSINDITYSKLDILTNQFANVLKNLKVQKADSVFSLLGRVPELYIAVLGTLKHRSIFCPLFSAFGPEPIKSRLDRGRGKVLLTTKSLYLKKVKSLREVLPELKYILLIDEIDDIKEDGVFSLSELMNQASTHYEIQETKEDDPALLHFTSGTTGFPKGALHIHRAVLSHYWTGKLVLDFHQDDIFWCTADPGWVTGTSYGIIAPLTHGITSIVNEEEYNIEQWYQILSEQKISIWYTAPTALRMAMKSGVDLAKNYDFKNLRLIASVGEPLNPEVVYWGLDAFGLPIHDNWWQTETGGIMIANYSSMDIKPGSMGRPVPGVEVELVERTNEGIKIVTQPEAKGEIAIKIGWPSMFQSYLKDQEKYDHCFRENYYLSGDIARRDKEGYFWFIGRVDDIIKSSGHLIGPFEVESALMEHPSIIEVGVIGKPDPIAMEIVKAFVVLKKDVEPSEDLLMDIKGFSRKKLGAGIAPKEIEFVKDLPKTKSGKIMRRLLKARELGLPEGDISTLENPQCLKVIDSVSLGETSLNRNDTSVSVRTN